jgi:selenoprotein W-related protein
MQAQMRRELFANDARLAGYSPDAPFAELPEEIRTLVRDATTAFREKNRLFSDREVVREIRAILEHGTAQAERTGAQTSAASAPGASAQPTIALDAKHAKVSITYCSECGYEPQTLELTSALMRAFPEQLSLIEIIPWQDGAFDVTVNGDLVHSMFRDGGFPENETILAAVRERIAR